MDALLPYLGLCPSEVLADAALSFELEFVWQNHQALGTSTVKTFNTPLLRAGFWNVFFEQISPASYLIRRPTTGDSWVVGNYKINETLIANNLISLVDDTGVETTANSLGETGPETFTVGSFIIGPGNTIIEEIPPCACSAFDAGSDYIQFRVENDLDGLDWGGRLVPVESTVKIRGVRQ